MDRIIAAMPSGNANLVNQKSLYVAISRARDRADLVMDGPKRLADQVERATGERIAALDAVAEQGVLEAGKQGELTLETHDERSWEVGDALDCGQEAERSGIASPGPTTRSSPTSATQRENGRK